MSSIEAIEDWKGVDVVDPEGEKIGKLDEVWFRAGEADPVLLSVKSGLLGRSHSLVPLDGATIARDYVRVRFSKQEVSEAPGPDSGTVTSTEIGRVGDHYGVDIDGPQDAELESGAQRTERLRAADEALARADELAAAAQRADQDAQDAAERAEVARQQAADAETHRTDAHREAEEARADADRKLALVQPVDSGATAPAGGATAAAGGSTAGGSTPVAAPAPAAPPAAEPAPGPAERFDSPPPDAA